MRFSGVTSTFSPSIVNGSSASSFAKFSFQRAMIRSATFKRLRDAHVLLGELGVTIGRCLLSRPIAPFCRLQGIAHNLEHVLERGQPASGNFRGPRRAGSRRVEMRPDTGFAALHAKHKIPVAHKGNLVSK
jgi:hypothetical protein